MLLGKTRYPSVPSLRHLAEIVIPGCFKLSQHYTDKVGIEERVASLGENVKLMDNMDIIVKFISWLLGTKDENEIRYKLTSSLVWYNEDKLPTYYLGVREVRDHLKRPLRKMLTSKRISSNKLNDSVYEELLDNFKERVESFSSNGKYDPVGEGNLVGFLVHTMTQFWGPSCKDDIKAIINSRGMFEELPNQDFSDADLHKVDIKAKEDLVEFQEIYETIYKCSKEIYTHSGFMIYDLFSRIKAKRGKEVVDNINRHFRNSKHSSSLRFTFIDKNAVQTDKVEIRNKYVNRDEILSYVDRLLIDSCSQGTLVEIIDNVIAVAGDQLKRKKKDGFSIFSTNEKRNLDKVHLIISATTKLRKLLTHLSNQNIDIFSIPSDIFRDKFQNKNIRTLKGYLEGYDLRLELMEEDSEDPETDNSNMFAEALHRASLNRISAVPLFGLKAILNMNENKLVTENKTANEDVAVQRYLEEIVITMGALMFQRQSFTRKAFQDIPSYKEGVLEVRNEIIDRVLGTTSQLRIELLSMSFIEIFKMMMVYGKVLSIDSEGYCDYNPDNWKAVLNSIWPEQENLIDYYIRPKTLKSLDLRMPEDRDAITQLLVLEQAKRMAIYQVVSMATICLLGNRNSWSEVTLFKALASEIIESRKHLEATPDSLVPVSKDPLMDWGGERLKLFAADYLKLPKEPRAMKDIHAIDSRLVLPLKSTYGGVEDVVSVEHLWCKQTNLVFLASQESLFSMDVITEGYRSITKHFDKLFSIAASLLDKFEAVSIELSCSDFDMRDIPDNLLETAQIISALDSTQNNVIDSRRTNQYGFYLDNGLMRPDEEKSKYCGVSVYKHASGLYFSFENGNVKVEARV